MLVLALPRIGREKFRRTEHLGVIVQFLVNIGTLAAAAFGPAGGVVPTLSSRYTFPSTRPERAVAVGLGIVGQWWYPRRRWPAPWATRCRSTKTGVTLSVMDASRWTRVNREPKLATPSPSRSIGV